jgi:hypothetical protein
MQKGIKVENLQLFYVISYLSTNLLRKRRREGGWGDPKIWRTKTRFAPTAQTRKSGASVSLSPSESVSIRQYREFSREKMASVSLSR